LGDLLIETAEDKSANEAFYNPGCYNHAFPLSVAGEIAKARQEAEENEDGPD
jgi:hypothetical protein